MNNHLKAALEALWSNSNGSWEQLMKLLNEELGKQVKVMFLENSILSLCVIWSRTTLASRLS